MPGGARCAVKADVTTTVAELKCIVTRDSGVPCGGSEVWCGMTRMWDEETVGRHVSRRENEVGVMSLHLRTPDDGFVQYYTDGSTPVARGGGFSPGASARNRGGSMTGLYRVSAITLVTTIPWNARSACGRCGGQGCMCE
jgi:hypothetical protein